MLSRLELIPRSRFPAFLTGSVAEEASIAVRHHANACSRSYARSIILRTTQPPIGLVVVALLPKTWQISESLSGDNDAISEDGFRVPQHQKRGLVKNLLR
jgi:hypothetical protein